MTELAYLIELVEEQNYMMQDLDVKLTRLLELIDTEEDDD